jgi:hypothetical protein
VSTRPHPHATTQVQFDCREIRRLRPSDLHLTWKNGIIIGSRGNNCSLKNQSRNQKSCASSIAAQNLQAIGNGLSHAPAWGDLPPRLNESSSSRSVLAHPDKDTRAAVLERPPRPARTSSGLSSRPVRRRCERPQLAKTPDPPLGFGKRPEFPREFGGGGGIEPLLDSRAASKKLLDSSVKSSSSAAFQEDE